MRPVESVADGLVLGGERGDGEGEGKGDTRAFGYSAGRQGRRWNRLGLGLLVGGCGGADGRSRRRGAVECRGWRNQVGMCVCCGGLGFEKGVRAQ